MSMLCEFKSKGAMLLRQIMNINNKEGYFWRKKASIHKSIYILKYISKDRGWIYLKQTNNHLVTVWGSLPACPLRIDFLDYNLVRTADKKTIQ